MGGQLTPYHFAAMVLLGGQAMQPAEDFAFRYEHFDCGAQLIDTFKGPYRRTIAGPNGGRGGDVSIPQDANVRLGNYMLEVRNAGREHTIWWRERSSAPTPSPITEEDRRRDELMRTIFRVVYAHPLVQRLPPPMGGCE
jgi:hypothetical protein